MDNGDERRYVLYITVYTVTVERFCKTAASFSGQGVEEAYQDNKQRLEGGFPGAGAQRSFATDIREGRSYILYYCS